MDMVSGPTMYMQGLCILEDEDHYKKERKEINRKHQLWR
jgi:hypothetical protein